MRGRTLLEVATFTLLAASASVAHADILPEGHHRVPVAFTFEGQEAFKDTSFVLSGCTPEGSSGRHYFTFVKGTEPVRCMVKFPPVLYAVGEKDKKALEELHAKDLGYGTEASEARKIFPKAGECGDAKENALVDDKAGVTAINAKYAIEKTATGCALKKISSSNVTGSVAAAAGHAASASSASTSPDAAASGAASEHPAPSAAPLASGSAAPSNPEGTNPSTSTAPSEPPKKSGCAVSAMPRGSRGGPFGLLLASIGVALAARRRGERAARS